MAAGDYAMACGKFAESQSEDPREGTLINLALCEEALRRLAVARQYWQQAKDLAVANADPRADYDAQQFGRIDGRVPRLSIKLEGDAPPDTRVTRDAIEFGAGSLGVPLPIDPGKHVVRATAVGRMPRDFTIELQEGESSELVIGPGPAAPSTEPPREAPSPPIPTAPSGPRRILRPVAYGAGALGVVGLGVGAIFGVRAMQAGKAASGHCQGDHCDPVGTSARRDEIGQANIATAAAIAGAGLLAGASILWALTPPPGEAKHVRRNVAWVVGASGIAAAIVGGIFGVQAIEANRDSGGGCNGNLCDAQGTADRRDAIRSGDAATVLLSSGAALLAGAVALWATDPSATP